MMNEGYLTCDRTANGDEVLTPRYAVEPIIHYLKEKPFCEILCPFDKYNSKFVEILQETDFIVDFSHIETGKDFFTYTKEQVSNVDCIVSNPPYSIKDKVLEHLYYLDKPFMMLLPQNALQGSKRTKLFMKYGLEYLGFDKRINFYTKGEFDKIKKGTSFASGYFCRNVLPEKLIFEQLEIRQEHYLNS